MADSPGDPLIDKRRFPVHPSSAARVRAYLGDVVRLDPIRRAEAALLATEIIANSIEHTSVEHVEVSVVDMEHAVKVAVTHAAESAPGNVDQGFGLSLLDALSAAWGMEYEQGQLTTWFEVRTPGAFSPQTLSDEELLARITEQPLYGDELVRRYEPMAASIARRYRGKGIADDDLHQVALIALVKSIHRYDQSRGELPAFASVTISGELKRQLRDRGWSVHVPRGLQERAMAVSSAIEDLTQSTGRVPQVQELAVAMEMDAADVAEALSVVHGYRAISLDHDADGQTPPRELLAFTDPFLGDTATRTSIDEALKALPERERRIVYLRFYEDMTQSQIAEEMGMSQMHVSRLLAKSLDALGDALGEDV